MAGAGVDAHDIEWELVCGDMGEALTTLSPFAENLAGVQAWLAQHTYAPQVLAVSKTQPQAVIANALNTGHRLFAENRVQEAIEKFTTLKAQHPDLHLHLIGALQTNKVKDALAIFDAIHTLDRPKLAEKLFEAAANGTPLPPLFIQINTGEEPQKAGILPPDADVFIGDCLNRLRLPVVGLMCIPPVDDNPALHFALLQTIARRHGLTQLSIGMSNDWQTAVRFGATHIRLGTALFGEKA